MFFRTKKPEMTEDEVAKKYKLALSAIDDNVKRLRETKAKALQISEMALATDRK